MRRIKVLQFPIGNVRAGVTQYVLNNWDFIDSKKFQFDFATMCTKIDYEDRLKKQGCKVFYLSCYAEDNPERFSNEFNHILNENYDILHIHTSYWKGMLIENIAKERGVPKVIVHSHSSGISMKFTDEEKRRQAANVHNILKNRISPDLATDFWACSKLAAKWLFGNHVPNSSIKIMKNAIDVNKFTYKEQVRENYRQKLGLDDSLVLGHVGRFAHEKNHEMLIDVFYAVSEKIDRVKLLLIGCGELERDIGEKVRCYGLEDKVYFLGSRADVNALMQCMDIFLFPSLFEGFGMAVLEAQAAGLKVICSDILPSEIKITDNIDFLPFNIDKWVNKIVKYKDGYRRENQKESITRAGYNIHKQIKIIEREYQS